MVRRLVSGEGAEQGELGHAETLRKRRLVRPEQLERIVSVHNA